MVEVQTPERQQRDLGIINLVRRVVEVCDAVRDVHDLRRLLENDFQELFPHRMATCGICNIDTGRVQGYLNSGHPRSWIDQVLDGNNRLVCPVAIKWGRCWRPVIVKHVEEMVVADRGWVDAAKGHDINNMIVHGYVDITRGFKSYINLANNPDGWNGEHERLLNILIPHLHAALTRVFAGNRTFARKDPKLSQREAQILQWICSGKTNTEIGTILGISECTVKNHAQHIFSKLEVTNRTQAAVKATRLNIITN